VIDIDLLYLGNEVLTSEALTLPHPRIAQRRFVLQPLADIRPELILPGQTRSVRELLARLPAGDARQVNENGVATGVAASGQP
jgi:2-amino-4-hydroxy-6-hydroxymethyldihydropteridine diphosphokinase